MLVAALAVVALLPVQAQDDLREVLCLYDSTERAEPRHCEIHIYGEIVLNHLGLLAVYRDVNLPLPDDEAMARFRGVLTWFTDRTMRHGRHYWAWIARQLAAGRRVVMLGELGATTDVPPEFVNEALGLLGLTYLGGETDDKTRLEIVQRDRSVVEFERVLDGELRSYAHLKAGPGSRVYLRVRHRDRPGSESDLVMTGPRGGLSWVHVHFDPYVDRDHWHLNPFVFFQEAFGVEAMPRPDLTTAFGRRILFCSVDGDGIGNRVQPGPKTGRLAGEIVRDEFIKRYDAPFTVSVIAADLGVHAELAKSIFALPNVEAASHGFYHPISWSKRTLAYPGQFSLDREIRQAVRRVEEVAAPKPVKAFLWTGDCDPPPEAIDMVDALGLANLNGWDPGRFQNYSSFANLRPAVAPREGRLQFNARSMSENHFTDLWTRNFFAFRNAILSYVRSGEPRRINPIHIYFHFYVVEQPGGENALREIFEWSLRQDVFPMTASEYVAWVRGFVSARLERAGPSAWRVRGYGACRTLRFERTALVPDLEASRGVLGFRRTGDVLYVHLDAGDEALVVMGRTAPAREYLVEANGRLLGGAIEGHAAVRATFDGPGGLRRVSSDARRWSEGSR
jgi:hypothetical protein